MAGMPPAAGWPGEAVPLTGAAACAVGWASAVGFAAPVGWDSGVVLAAGAALAGLWQF